jgi:RecA-family ATPase
MAKAHDIKSKADTAAYRDAKRPTAAAVRFINMQEAWKMNPKPKEKLVESLIPLGGAVLLVGNAKAGKTIFAVQLAIAVAGGTPHLFDFYKVLKPGPVLFVEADDPDGPEAIIRLIKASPLARPDLPIHLADKAELEFGPEFIEMLRRQIVAVRPRLVILDSYTSLRSMRESKDIVKLEQLDLRMFDVLAKDTGCTIVVIHHGSKGSESRHWSAQAAGTYAMGMAIESMIHISRFEDLSDNSDERLLQVRGRSLDGTSLVLRYQKATYDYYHVMAGNGAKHFPLIERVRAVFCHQPFGPKDMCTEFGLSLATAGRHIGSLSNAGVLVKHGKGQYSLKPESAL